MRASTVMSIDGVLVLCAQLSAGRIVQAAAWAMSLPCLLSTVPSAVAVWLPVRRTLLAIMNANARV
jgi:hypothetical protein